MGLFDALKEEDRISVKFTTFYELLKESVVGAVLANGVHCDIPHRYLREIMFGEKETEYVISVTPPEGATSTTEEGDEDYVNYTVSVSEEGDESD